MKINLSNFESIANTTTLSRGKKYYRERIALVELEVLERLEPQKIDDFLKERLYLPDIRRKAIQRNIDNKKFILAKELCYKGIKIAQQEYPGLVRDFQKPLLEIAQLEDDDQGIKQYSVRDWSEVFANLAEKIQKNTV